MIATLLCKSIIFYEKQNNYLETLNTRLQAIHLLDSFEREKKLNVDYLYKIDVYERTANLHYKVGRRKDSQATLNCHNSFPISLFPVGAVRV